MPGIGLAPGGAVAMEDVCDLHPGAAHAAGLLSGSRPPLGQRRESVERAGHAADRGIGDPRVTGGGVELGVAEQHLDDANIGVLLQQVRSKAVPQRMRRHPLLDPGGLGCGMDGAVELAGREWLDRIAAWKQPALRQKHAEPAAPPATRRAAVRAAAATAWRSGPCGPYRARSATACARSRYRRP